MSQSKELNRKAGKAGLWYTVANMVLKGCVFLTLPVFTRILSTSDFGIYNAYIAYEQILQAILGLGLYGTVKNAKLDFEEKFDEYLSSVLTLSIIALLAVTFIVNICFGFIGPFLRFSRTVTNCLIFQSFGAYLIYFYGAKLNIEFKYKSFIAISFFNTLFNLAASILLILFVFPNERYLGRIVGSALPLIIIAVSLIIYIYFRGRTLYNKHYWKYALAIGIPLVPHVVSQSLLSQFDRIMIRDMIGSGEAGIYSYIHTICTITYVICSSFDNAWTPWVYMKLKNKDEHEIKSASTYYVLLFAALTLGFICVMPEVTKLIANSSYWSGIDLLIPTALANFCVFLYMLPVGIEYYNKKTQYISLGTVFAALLNLGLNFVAIKAFGYKAAAYTTLISYFALFLLHWGLSKKFGFENCYQVKKILAIFAGLFVISMTLLWVNNYYIIGLIIRYIIVVAILIGFFMEKDRVLSIIKSRGN